MVTLYFQVVWLFFTALDIELSVNCSADFVSVETIDPEIIDPVLKVCGQTLLPDATLSASSATVSFHSNAVGHGTGFMITYEGVKAGKN